MVDCKIFASNVSLTYNSLTFRSSLKPLKSMQYTALKNINLEINKGEVVALMGHNGAGKSSLLKLLAAKIKPSSGKVEINGELLHLAGINPGFDKFQTPRQNINWLLSAYGEKSDLTKQIEDFSDIGEAFDRPMKTLSGGMQGRVGFGFATSLNPEILLIDEVLGVGDPIFKVKAMKKLRNVIHSSGIVIMSTHSVGLVKEIATRCIILSHGEVIFDGDIENGLKIYTSLGNRREK